MSWNQEYLENAQIWGEEPSVLAKAAVHYLQSADNNSRFNRILDIGCGYGRNARYLAANLPYQVLGIDSAVKAIEMAAEVRPDKVQFQLRDFFTIEKTDADILFAANFYHLLRNEERSAFRTKIATLIRPQGLLFLNTLSVNDIEEYGQGKPCLNEANSCEGEKFRHFSTAQELAADFSFLNLKMLREVAYEEPHPHGKTHYHISWIMIGEDKNG